MQNFFFPFANLVANLAIVPKTFRNLLLIFTLLPFSLHSAEKILLDEADTLGAWKAFGVNSDAAFVKTGKVSAVWKGVSGRSFSSRSFTQVEDWSGFNAFTFWAYSGTANGAIFAVNVNASNTHIGDSFYKLVTVDWTGWKKIELPFSGFLTNRNALGWSRVNGLTFMSEGMGAVSKPDTTLYFDEIKVEKLSGNTLNNPDDAGAAGRTDGAAGYTPPADSVKKQFPVLQSAKVHIHGGGVRGFGMLARYESSPREVYLRRLTRIPESEPYAPIASATVFDPDGNSAAHWECTDQKSASEETILSIPPGKPGIWRVSFAGGRSGDQLDIGLPATRIWGVRGEMALGLQPSFPKKTFLYLPPTAKIVMVESSGTPGAVELFDERGSSLGSPEAASRRNFFSLKDLSAPGVLSVAIDPTAAGHIAFDGVPGLLCPSPEAAKSLAGGTVLSEGLLTAGPLPARARAWMVSQKDKNLSVQLAFPASVPENLKNPRIEALFFGKYGPLNSLKSALAAQNLDSAHPYYGVFSAPPKANDPPPVNWETFLHGPVKSPFDASGLANIVTFPGLMNPGYQNEALKLRAILSAFYHLASLQGDNLVREGDLTTGSYPITHVFFSYDGALAKPYYLLKKYLDPEAQKIWEEGLIAVGRKLADFQAYQSNQWMHVIRGHFYTYLATGRKEFLGYFERFMTSFVDNSFGPSSKFGQHPAGFYLEEGGPDGNYDHLSSYGMVSSYYDYSHLPEAKPELLAKMKKAIEKNLYFKSFYWLPQPAGVIPGITAPNCRTSGALGNPSYPGDFMASPKFALAAARLDLNRDPGVGVGAAGTFSHLVNSDAWARRVVEWGIEKKDAGFPDIFNVGGTWMNEIREAYSLPREVTPSVIPAMAESNSWELPGQFAWKEGALYGLIFYEVPGTKQDLPGKIGGGLTALWTKTTGIVVSGMNDPRKKTLKPSDIGHTCVYGEDASGKFFVTGLGGDRSQGSRTSGNGYRIVSMVKNLGVETSWTYRYDKDGANVAVNFPVDKVSSAFLSLPIYADEKDAALSLNADKNNFIYSFGGGSVEFSWPAGVEASLENADPWKIKRLVLKIPASGTLALSIKAR